MCNQQSYRLGALTLQLITADQLQQAQVAAAWQHLFRIAPGAAPDAPAATLRLHLVAPPLPAAAAPPPFTPPAQGPIAVWPVAGGLCCRCGATAFQIDAGQPHAVGYMADDFWEFPLLVQRTFWQTLFFLLVRRTGCTFLHANTLYPADLGPAAGVLLVGDCGSGKTSLTLSLLSAGWHYVTDDTVLLQLSEPADPTPARQGNAIWAHAVRRGFACTTTTVAQWPWLAALAKQGVALNRQKVLIDPDALYPTGFAPRCTPRVLCFPQICHTAQSQVRPLTPTQSFQALLGQPRNGLLSEPAFTPTLLTHFQALVEQCASYELALGRDVFDAPAQVSALLLDLLPTPGLEVTAR